MSECNYALAAMMVALNKYTYVRLEEQMVYSMRSQCAREYLMLINTEKTLIEEITELKLW